MEKKTVGAWIIHHTGKLGSVQELGDYGRIRLAGKSGQLLSAISSTDQSTIGNTQLRTLARFARIDEVFELPILVDHLKRRQLIDVGDNGIEVLGLTSAAVLQHTADVFAGAEPSPQEAAIIELAEQCSAAPMEGSALCEQLGDRFHINKKAVKSLLEDAEQIGFTDFEPVGSEKLYFNGNLFRSTELRKTRAILDGLKPTDATNLSEVQELLRVQGCMPETQVKEILGDGTFQKLQSIGMFDVNVVENPTESIGYVTLPSAFSKYGGAKVSDAFDLAKALVASITYGIQRSDPARGRIRMVEALLRKLIAGGSVGPADAIGEDYRVLEMRRVIQVTRDRYAFSMRLLKRDIGELALQVIEEGDVSERSLPHFPGASITTFRAPEEQRVNIRKLPTRGVDDLLQRLRTARHVKS